MLEEKDLKKIKRIMNDEIDDLAIKIIKPSFDKIDKHFIKVENRLDGVENRLDGVENRLDGVENRLDGVENNMVTKSYLDDKLSDLEGSVIVRQRKQDKKVELLIEFLKNKNILKKEEIKMLKEFQIFPNRN